jgi:hypothetical protein
MWIILTPEKERFGASRNTYRGKGRTESRALQAPWSLRERRAAGLPASQNTIMNQTPASSRHFWHTKELQNSPALSHTTPVTRNKRPHSYDAKLPKIVANSADSFRNFRGQRPSTKMIWQKAGNVWYDPLLAPNEKGILPHNTCHEHNKL